MKGNVFTFERDDEGIGVVTFNVPGEAMNTWTPQAVEEAVALVGELEKARDLIGVIFISGKPGTFHAGANLNVLNAMGDAATTRASLDLYHHLFHRFSVLPFPTLAAIEGHCLGGGLEFALVCTGRMAKESKTTLIGLPECNLGIFPGAGGTQRLPRLIGYAAIELVLRGKVLSGQKALDVGIIDRLVPAKANLLAEAGRFLKEMVANPGILKRESHDFSQIDAVADMARQEILKVTRGREIPGPMLAVKTMQEGLKVPLDQGLEIEKQYFVEAVLSNQAKGSIHTFFLKTMSDNPAKMMTRGFEPKPILVAAVLGFGMMGRGIVVDLLRHTDIQVVAKDVPEALEPGRTFVHKILSKLHEKKPLKTTVDDLMKRLTLTSDYGPVGDVDLVIEAVYEDIKIKAPLYEELSRLVREDCIIASNTSSIPLDAMAPHVRHPERFGGLHFFSPVWLMELVEVVRGRETSPQTVDNLLHVCGLMRKRPVVCRDYPGFVVNALLFPYLLKALAFLEAGTPIERIDEAFTSFGMPVGPVKLMDEVGIDIIHHVLEGRGIEQETLRNMVKDGRKGLKKSGKGFFLEDGRVDPQALSLVALKGKRAITGEEMVQEVLTEMVTVGNVLLDNHIVEDPRMIDIGMIWGTGFPADRGGPMKWADLTGLSQQLFQKPFYG